MSANGYVQLIRKGAVPKETMDPVINTISRNILQITALVNDILIIQEMDLIIPKFEAVDMEDIAMSIIERYQEKASKNNEKLIFSTEEVLPKVSGDAKHLERALTSLVDNAVNFSPNGGDVTISLTSDHTNVIIKVSDNGVGITEKEFPLIFDRFYHVDSSNSGGNLFGGLG